MKIFAFTRVEARLQIPQQGLSYADKSKGTAYIERAWTFSTLASAELFKAARIFNLKKKMDISALPGGAAEPQGQVVQGGVGEGRAAGKRT